MKESSKIAQILRKQEFVDVDWKILGSQTAFSLRYEKAQWGIPHHAFVQAP
jgi:hypothetical protein